MTCDMSQISDTSTYISFRYIHYKQAMATLPTVLLKDIHIYIYIYEYICLATKEVKLERTI